MPKYDPLKELKKEKVSIWRRGFAFLIDIIIIEFLVNLNFGKLLENDLNSSKSLVELLNNGLENYSTLQPKLFIISIITLISALLYFTLLEWKLKQTLGKMILKIKVSSENKKLEFWQAFVRNIPKVSLFFNYTVFLLIIDLIYNSFTGIRLFDKFARTYVDKVK